MIPPSSLGSQAGSSLARTVHGGSLREVRRDTMSRAMPSACSSSGARWAATPLIPGWTSAPPRSSPLTPSPVAALPAGLVGDDHPRGAADAPEAGGGARGGRGPVVHAVGGENPDLQEGRAAIEQAVHAIAHRQLALLALPPLRLITAAGVGHGEMGLQLRLEPVHVREVGPELGPGGIDLALDDGHGVRRSMPRPPEPLALDRRLPAGPVPAESVPPMASTRLPLLWHNPCFVPRQE